MYTDELILTNLNVVLVKKGLFGNGKGIRVFPINQVKVFNGQAQAVVGKKPNGSAALEVYFVNGQEKFAFQAGGKRKVSDWISRINFAVTGQEYAAEPERGLALPGAGLVAGVLKDTYGVFKAKLGTTDVLVKVAGKCTGVRCAPFGKPRIGRQLRILRHHSATVITD